jgi:hypothetical protein
VKHPYGSTSLAVWLAAKDSGGQPARQLDPRRCFTDSELVIQVINMLKGLLMPGLAFKFEQETESYKVCRGVHTSDLPPASTASLLTTFISLATHLRRIQTFCDAIVFTSASDNLVGNTNNEKKSNTIALRALPTVAAFAASVSRQVVAIRGQLIELETTSTMNNLLSLRLKLALMNRQVAALHAVVKECFWRGTAACTASALLDTLYSVLEMHLMRSGEHSGAVAAMVVEIFCAAWKPLNDALDAWLRRGSLVDAPPEFYITQKTTETNRTRAFWRDQYQLQQQQQMENIETESENENEKNSVAIPALLAPFAELLLQAGLASVVLTLSSNFEQQQQEKQPDESMMLSLHTEFVELLSALIEKKPSIPSPSIAGTTPTSTIPTVTTSMSGNSIENGDFKDGLCLKQWTAAVSRSPATALVPLAEDISDLSLFPTSVLDLPEAYMCPEITALMRGGEEGENEERKKHPVAVAMSMASAARAQQAAAGKTDVVIAAEFDDILSYSNEEVFGGAGRKYFSTTTASLVAAGEQKKKRQESSRIALDAASWATSLPLEVLTQVCLVYPIQKRMKHAEKQACKAILHAGLLPQLKTLETVAAAAGPVLEPFVQYLLRNSSTPRGVDGLSPFELHSALANALTQAGEQALPGLASVAVEIAPAVDSSGTTLLSSSGVCSVSSLRRIIPNLHPSFPLNLIANDSFLQLHTMLWTLSLQLQWVAQSLVAARVGLWKEHQKDATTTTDIEATNYNSSTSTRAAQQEMLHLVHSVRQHMLTQVESAGVRMRRGIATCSSVREMEHRCRVYEEELRLGCLLRFQTETNGAIVSPSFAASSFELHSLLLDVLESSLQHCILLDHAHKARSAVNKAKQAQLEAEDAEEEALALDALEPAEEKLTQISLAVAATEREFEGHRVAFMQRVVVYGNEAGAHSEALKALLAAVDLEGRWQPPPPGEDEENM